MAFAASVKIKNVGSNVGTFGEDVPLASPLGNVLGSWPVYLTGVRNLGTIGTSGYRTNVGLWSLDATSPVTVAATLYSASGVKIWQQPLQVRRHEVVLYGLPDSLSVDKGLLVIDPQGQYLDVVPFLSVIDNKSGDGVTRYGLGRDPDTTSGCETLLNAVAPLRNADERGAAEHLRRVFLDP